MRKLVAASVLSAAAVAPLAASGQEAPFGGEQERVYAETLWNQLAAARLVGDGAFDAVPYKGTEPHGAMLETFYGTLEVDGHTGMVSVKRNYGPAGVTAAEVQGNRAEHLGAVTVMFRRADGYDPRHGNWFWAKYLPDGSLDQTPEGTAMAGQVVGCIECDQEAPGDDYLYTTDHTR